MKMYIAGQWVDRDNTMLVLNPFDQSLILYPKVVLQMLN